MLVPLDQRCKDAVGYISNSCSFLNNIPCEYYKGNEVIDTEVLSQANVVMAYAVNIDTLSLSISTNRKYNLAINDDDFIIATPVYRKDRTISKFILRNGERDYP